MQKQISERDPIFATLDAMILAGWGDVPQNIIPHNWLECSPPAKFHSHPLITEARAVDIARIERDNTPGAIERVEAMNLVSQGHVERAQRIVDILRAHRGGKAERERRMRERQREAQRFERSERLRGAWRNIEKFQSRRLIHPDAIDSGLSLR